MSEAGISKSDNLIDMRQLEACIRSELDLTAQRRIAVLDPVKLVVDNYPADKTELFLRWPTTPTAKPTMPLPARSPLPTSCGLRVRILPRCRPPKFKRLTIGGEVRLMGAYIVNESVEKNPDGSIAAIHCTADLETGNGNPADGRKIMGTSTVSATTLWMLKSACGDKLFTEANMNAIPEGSDYKDYLNPRALWCARAAS